jgi:major intracellular serine protease
MNNNLHEQFPEKGLGIRVVLLDSGTDTAHPAFASHQIEYKDLCYAPSGPKDAIGHGSHCAGVILSVAPSCTLLSGRIATHSGLFTYDALFDGLQWAKKSAANVVCICTGERFGDDDVSRLTGEISAAGACVVSAIGNNGGDGKDSGIFPALYPQVIAAGSVDEDGTLLPFVEVPHGIDLLCYGGLPFNGPWIDNQYDERGGTSVSAGLISGLIALAMSSGKLQLTAEFPTIKSKLLSVMEKKESARGPYYVYDPFRLC